MSYKDFRGEPLERGQHVVACVANGRGRKLIEAIVVGFTPSFVLIRRLGKKEGADWISSHFIVGMRTP